MLLLTGSSEKHFQIYGRPESHTTHERFVFCWPSQMFILLLPFVNILSRMLTHYKNYSPTNLLFLPLAITCVFTQCSVLCDKMNLCAWTGPCRIGVDTCVHVL